MFYIDNKLVLKKYIPSQLRGMLRSERLLLITLRGVQLSMEAITVGAYICY